MSEPVAKMNGRPHRQVLMLVLSRGIAAVAQAATLVIVARITTVEAFGVLAVVSAIAVVACSVADLGMSHLASKARALGHDGEVASALRINSMSTMLGAVAGTLLMLGYSPAGLGFPLAVLVVGFFVEKNADALLAIPIADKNDWVPAFSIVGRRALGLAVLLVLPYFDVRAELAYAVGYLLGSLLAQFLGVRYSRASRSGDVVYPRWRTTARRGLPYLVPNLAGQSRLIDVGIVALVLGPSSGAIYAAGTRLAQPLLLVPSALGTVLLPHATGKPHEYGRALAGRLLVVTGIGVAALIPFAFGGELIVTLLFGPSYAGGGIAFSLGTYAVLFIGLASPLQGALQGLDDERFVSWVTGGSAVALLALVGWGTVAGGVGGAALGLLLAAVARWLTLTIRLFRR